VKYIGQFFRLFHISWVLVRHGLDEILFASHLFRPLHFLRWIAWWRVLRNRDLSHGVRLREALIELGPIFVKFGQILSTRRDLLPDDIADELAKLQDRVPPFPTAVAREIIEASFKAPMDELFQEFSETPLASASIAQVHTVVLKDGRKGVIKVLRPDIEPVIRRDISLLYILAGHLQRFWADGRRLRPIEVVHEFEKTILDELDLMREAASAAQIRRNFEGSELLYVPEIYWDHCRKKVMVMEQLHGIPMGNIAEIKAAGIDMKRLGAQGVEIFFTQVFRHNFFHADMHPGNIFVEELGDGKARYQAVDFGIVGTLSHEDQRYLAENFIAFFRRDYHRVAELHVESGWVPAHTRVDEFEAAIRTVCEPIFEKPLSEISFGQVLLRLFQTARRFDMEVQPQLVLLQKTLLNIEGLGRQLYPQLDLWDTAKPFLERWMSEQLGPKSFIKRMQKELPHWGEALPEIPMLLHSLLKQARNGELPIKLNEQSMRAIRQEIREANRRTVAATIGVGLIISAAVLLGLDGYTQPMFSGAPVLSWVLGIAGLLSLIVTGQRR
jgi:ubiquinone biosynthesis protein